MHSFLELRLVPMRLCKIACFDGRVPNDKSIVPFYSYISLRMPLRDEQSTLPYSN
jgi:hypothetical protein